MENRLFKLTQMQWKGGDPYSWGLTVSILDARDIKETGTKYRFRFVPNVEPLDEKITLIDKKIANLEPTLIEEEDEARKNELLQEKSNCLVAKEEMIQSNPEMEVIGLVKKVEYDFDKVKMLFVVTDSQFMLQLIAKVISIENYVVQLEQL